MANNKRLDTLKIPAVPVPGLVTGVGGLGLGGPAQMVGIAGSFLTNGASDPVASSNRGHPFVVKHTSTGLYTVTLGGLTQATGFYGVKQLVAVLPILGKGSPGTAVKACPGALVDLSGTFQIRLEADSTAIATDVAAGADNRVFFIAWFLQGGR